MRVFIFGAQRTGKTELLKQLNDQTVTRSSSPDYKTTVGPSFERPYGMMVWDSPATNGLSKNYIQNFALGAELGVYCINLSEVIDDNVLEQMRIDIQLFKIRNAAAKLILVGTFSDRALEENTVESLRNKVGEFGFIDVFTVTTETAYGTQPVLKALKHYKDEKDQKLLDTLDSFPSDSAKELNKLEKLLNNLPDDSDLYSALNKLKNQAIRLGLKAEEIDVLGDEVNSLLVKITDSSLLDKTKAYNEFLVNCDAKFTEKYHGLKAAVKTFAAVVLVTALAAGLFFGAGVVLGAWAGASAFFTALVEGTAGAAVFTAGTTATNLTSFAYFGNSFFQKPVKNAAGEFIESVKNANIEDLNLNSAM